MRKQLRNERGLTLIEVLAATVIGTMLILLIGNALLFGLKQYKNQTIKAQELTDVTIVAKVITKDIRKATEVNVDEVGDILILTIDDKEIRYELDEGNNSLLKNKKELYYGIELFKVSLSDNFVKIKIESPNENGIKEKINTDIYIRGGV